MKSLIKELKELQATLKDDGYKDWCYAQLTIDKAIKVVKNCTIPLVSNSFCYLYKKQCIGNLCSVTPYPEKCEHLKQNDC